MRQIGTLPKSLDPTAFADYLLSIGMKTRVDERPEGWDLWIYNEDHFARARDELAAYLLEPGNPRYRAAAQSAETIRRTEKQLDQKFRKNFRDASDVWGEPGFRHRPLTTLLIAASVVIFIAQNLPPGQFPNLPTGWPLIQLLLFSSVSQDEHGVLHMGLEDIESGQVWRLVTPALMHVNFIHILFNMMWLRLLGTMIEVRKGTLRLAVLFLVSAAVSNYGQYLWYVRMEQVKFAMGMSGVIYGFFGYVWMKGLYQPEQRMGVSQGNVNLMIGWLFLCMTGVIGPVGNAAHFVGLAVGVVFGLLRF